MPWLLSSSRWLLFRSRPIFGPIQPSYCPTCPKQIKTSEAKTTILRMLSKIILTVSNLQILTIIWVFMGIKICTCTGSYITYTTAYSNTVYNEQYKYRHRFQLKYPKQPQKLAYFIVNISFHRFFKFCPCMPSCLGLLSMGVFAMMANSPFSRLSANKTRSTQETSGKDLYICGWMDTHCGFAPCQGA